MGFAVGLGALAGMSHAGVSVSEMNLDNDQVTFRGVPFPLRLRMVLEGAATLQQAMTVWNSTNNTNSFNFLIGSAADGSACALEVRRDVAVACERCTVQLIGRPFRGRLFAASRNTTRPTRPWSATPHISARGEKIDIDRECVFMLVLTIFMIVPRVAAGPIRRVRCVSARRSQRLCGGATTPCRPRLCAHKVRSRWRALAIA